MAKSSSKTFGYCRVSAKDQKEDRQIESMLKQGINERDIFLDKLSGKNFDRPQYQAMKVQLRENDLVVIHSLDRLGRNYTQIHEEWRNITKEIKANIRVLDMPLLDTTLQNGLLGKVIADVVLILLAYVAQKERELNHERQEAGIRIAKQNGVKFGRPIVSFPHNWNDVYETWQQGHITATEAMKRLNLKRTSFYKLVKVYSEKEAA